MVTGSGPDRRPGGLPRALDPASPVQRALILASGARLDDPDADARTDGEVAADLGVAPAVAASLIDESLDLVAGWMYGLLTVTAARERVLDRDEAVDFVVSRGMVDAGLVTAARRRSAQALVRHAGPREGNPDDVLVIDDDGGGLVDESAADGPSRAVRRRSDGVGLELARADIALPPRVVLARPPWSSVLDQPPPHSAGAQARRRAAIGAVVGSAVITTVILWFALRELDAPLVLVTAFAAGLLVLKAAIDWTLITTRPRRVPWARLAAMGTFAVLLGGLTADLVLLVVFRPEVEAEVIDAKVTTIQERAAEEVAALPDQPGDDAAAAAADQMAAQVTALEVEARETRTLCEAERDGTGGSGIIGTGPRAQALCEEADRTQAELSETRDALDMYQEEAQAQAAEGAEAQRQAQEDVEARARADIAALPDPTALERLEAVGDVVPPRFRLVMIAFLVLLDLLPVVVLGLGGGWAGGREPRALAPWRAP